MFTRDLFHFLTELAAHNERDWFSANKARYKELAEGPLKEFVANLAAPLAEVDPHVRGSVFRIYRDTRFSTDKSPYKVHVAAHFAGQGVHTPGYYLHLQPGKCFMGVGLWRPEPPVLAKIREALVARPEAWVAARDSVPPLEGDTLQRPPKGYDAAHPLIVDLKRKDFITSLPFTEAEVCAPGFPTQFVAACTRVHPLVRFLFDAVS